jgi:fructosamine-3-kinase
MECIVQGRGGSSSAAYRRFARQLADLHRTTAGKRIGWERDNYLGSAKQPNTPHETWAEFVADQRIGFQIRWARDQGLADRQLQSDCETIIARMAGLLDGRQDQTSLLHGDLWSGNYLFDAHGQPAIIDPAVYYGCREAEWGMIAWFGSCPAAFDQAYQERWPMPEGWQRRIQVYKLYHQLNHLNLFGSSYAGICRSTARRILG